MVNNQIDHESIPDTDDSTIYTPTRTETVGADFLDEHDLLGDTQPSSFLVPWPGSTFIIRSALSGHVLTLLDGQIVLTEADSRGSMDWACVETNGWLGFRNVCSGKFLGHDFNGRLRCSAGRHQGWEYFCARMRPEGGCVLLMTHWDGLWQVGIKVEQGVEKLAKIEDGGSERVVWEFIKILED